MGMETTGMSSFDDSGGGPAILQLRRWCQFQPKLKDFHQAFISPTRNFLLLLSYQCEALLVSLDKDRLCNGFLEPRTSKFSQRESTDSCLLESTDNIAWSTASLGTESSNKCASGGSSISEQVAVIWDVKSLAWVHCGDTYGQHGGSIFREVLVVSGDHGITVHAFGHLDTVTQEVDSIQKTDIVHGRWVEWGPNHDEQAPNKFNSGSSCGDFCETKGIASTKVNENVHDETEASRTSSWFRTFLVEVDPSNGEGDFVVYFPVKSSVPHCAEVLSFSIFDRVLKFLEFHTSKKNCAYGDVSESPVPTSVCEDPGSFGHHTYSDTESKSPTTGVHKHDEVGCVPNLYKCSRVFSSSSNHYVGLVLMHDVDASDYANGKRITLPKTLIIVLVVSHRGMQWVCSVDLQECHLNLNLVLDWADFQFLEDFLVCLNMSGVVYIYDVKNGNIVSYIDVLHNCDVHLRVNSELDQEIGPVKGNSFPVMEKSTPDFQRINDFYRKGTHSEKCVTTGRIFRRLLVTSCSQLLAAMDEHGLIYLICIGGYELEKNGFCKFMPPFRHFGLDILAGWKVAAAVIGRQKAFSEFLSDLSLNFSSGSHGKFSNTNCTAEVKCRKKKRQYIQFMGGQMDSYPNVFSSHLQIESCPICQCKLPAICARRVFLPPDKFSMEDAACLSPFGIIQFIRRSQNKTKIVHMCLHTATSAFDERDLNSGLHSRRFSSISEQSALGSEAIGCCFEGFLYLVTEDGLSVVLPSLSISSDAMQRETINYWQSNIAGICLTEATLGTNRCRDIFRPWQVEVLDRTLLYEGPEEADYICRGNGWDLKIARIRRLELALCYLKVDEIQRSLEMLADANLAEEGTLRLLLTAAYKIFCKVGSENEVATASRNHGNTVKNLEK